MTRTNKIKKKTSITSINPKTQISIKPIHNSGITKKKNAKYYIQKNKLRNGKISSKLLEHIKTKKNKSLEKELNYELNQYGGFLGLDYIALRWKMSKFLNIVKKLNESDVKFQKDIESYKLQAKLFEERANSKAEYQTQFIDAFRQKQMYKFYEQDEQEAPKTKETKAIIIQDSFKILDNKMVDLSGRISQLDKEIGKDMKEYNKLMKEFKSKVDNFEKITNKYSKISNFQEEIATLKKDYDSAILLKQEGLIKADKNKIKKFEKHKEEYTKILSLTAQEIQNRIKIKQEIGDLQTTSEYYLDQFGTYEGKKKRTKGVLDIEFKNIKCEFGSGTELLCKWVKQYTEFSNNLFTIDKICWNIISNMKKIQKSAEICVKNLVTVFQKYDKDPQPQAMLRFEGDIIELIKLFTLASKAIGKLKAEFYKQTPASRINIDYNELTVEFNYLRAKLKVYVNMFNPDQTDPTKDIKKTGGYRMIGGSGGRGRGSPRQPVAQKNICGSPYYKDKLDNKSFLKIKIDYFINYKKLYDAIKDKTKIKDCFNNLDNFKIIFNNYYQVWLFWLNVNQNLNNVNTNDITADNKKSLEYFQIIKKVLEEAVKTKPTDNDKWFWDDNLKDSIRQIFAKITHFEIPNDFTIRNIKQLNLKEIFIDTTPHPTAQAEIDTIRAKNDYDATKHLVCKMNNDGSPSTHPKDFYGVEQWDKEVETIVTYCSQLNGSNNDVFNKYLNELIQNIQKSKYPDYFDPNTATAPPAPTQPAPTAQAQNDAKTRIQDLIKKAQKLKTDVDNNYLFYQGEYVDFLDSILRVLKKQEETVIIAANQTKLDAILTSLQTHIDTKTVLSPAEIANYKAEIAIYTGWYFQPILNAYEVVKARYYGNTQQEAKTTKAVDEVRKKIESGTPGDIALQEVINMDEFKDPKSNPLPVVPGATVVLPPTGTGTALDTTITSTPITNNQKEQNNQDKKERDKKEQDKKKIEATDANLIRDVRRRIFLFGDYDVQLKNISTEYENIFKTLGNLLEGSSSIKKMADTLQGLTQNLIELKYIEPKITGVSAWKDTSIRLPGADWIVPPAVKEFDKLQALSITKELQEARKKNRDMYKIYEETTSATSEELRKLFEQILINAGDKSKVSNFFRVATNLDYLNKMSNPANFNKIIEMLKATVKVDGSEDTKHKVCNILNGIRDNIGFADDKIRATMLETMNLYDPNAKDKNNPCYSEKKDKKPRDGSHSRPTKPNKPYKPYTPP